MKSLSTTELRRNIYKIIDEVLATGVGVEVMKKGQKVRILPAVKTDKMAHLVERPNVIQGDPEAIVHCDWEKELNFDLP